LPASKRVVLRGKDKNFAAWNEASDAFGKTVIRLDFSSFIVKGMCGLLKK